MKSKQMGFTLVEIAIVLVIIGLLLGGVLKGQEMVNSAKVKSLANDFKAVPAMLYGYQDRFRAVPGDDAAVVAHVGGTLATTPAGTIGNGAIDGFWNSVTTTDQSLLFWQHVRLANLASGTTTVAGAAPYIQTNAVGGTVGISSTMPITGMNTSTYYVCSGAVDGRLAQQLDTTMDDGAPGTGSMRGSTGTAGSGNTAAAAYTPGTTYTICMSI